MEDKEVVVEKEVVVQDRMKTSTLIKIMACAVLMIFIVYCLDTLATGGKQTVTGPYGEFTVEVPKNWVAEINGEGEEQVLFLHDGTAEGAEGEVVEPTSSLVVMHYPVQSEDYESAFFLLNLMHFQFGYQLDEPVDGDVNGQEVKFFNATLGDPTQSYYQQGFLTFNDGKLYMVIGSSEEGLKDTTLPVFEEILASFKFAE